MRRAWISLLWLTPLLAAPPEVVSVQKIWDAGVHNAFTDLIRFRDRWYCTFRESEGHVGGNGKLRVLVSDRGGNWDSAALLAEDGIDLRDPKLSITPDERLMILAGGSVYEGTALKGRQPRVAFSTNGRDWTRPQRILAEGDWLWRVTWWRGRAYGVSYRGDRTGVLYSSADGIHYEAVTELDAPGVSEVTLRFLSDGEIMALVRRETDDRNGWIGASKPPYRQWTWYKTTHRLGGPNFIVLPDGRFWAAGREHTPDGPRTVLAKMGRQSYEPVLTLPSEGDTSYPGLVWYDGLLWMSYYSSHEGKSAIYLAKIRL